MRFVNITFNEAKALSHPTRWKIIVLLMKNELSVYDLKKILRDKNKNPTTIRHHLKKLRESGIIHLSKIIEKDGYVVKYYRSNIKIRNIGKKGD